MTPIGRAEKIIEAVRARPFLYDQNLQSFKHIAMKNRNWMEVAKIVYGHDDKVTVNRVKIQWKSLRDSFVKQQRKRQGCNSVRPYLYEAEMKFLLPHILVKGRDEWPIGENENRDECDSGSGNESVPPLLNFEVKTEGEDSVSFSGDSRTEMDMMEGQPEVPSDELSGGNVNREMHPVDAFFYGIAQTVKQLHPGTIAKVKKAVANIVMDAEIEEIEQWGVSK